MTTASFVYVQLRSHEKSNMTSDLEEEMQSESESSVDIRELLPRKKIAFH